MSNELQAYKKRLKLKGYAIVEDGYTIRWFWGSERAWAEKCWLDLSQQEAWREIIDDAPSLEEAETDDVSVRKWIELHGSYTLEEMTYEEFLDRQSDD